jgi:hypothetical protein
VNTKGIFSGAVVIRGAGDGHIGVTIDGASDELGFGEALGFAAAAWLESTPEEERGEAARKMLVGFVAFMQDGGGRHVAGTVEQIEAEPMPGGKH